MYLVACCTTANRGIVFCLFDDSVVLWRFYPRLHRLIRPLSTCRLRQSTVDLDANLVALGLPFGRLTHIYLITNAKLSIIVRFDIIIISQW